MALRDDLIAAKALIEQGRTLLDAMDLATGDHLPSARVSVRGVAMINALNRVRPKAKGRARPTLREMHDRNFTPDLMALFDRAIAAAGEA